jgi:energy-coupling factor transporter ATP-binding protein EcfA2
MEIPVIDRIVVKGYRLFSELDLRPMAGMNIIVGDNQSGKSTLLEAVNLCITGKTNGRWAAEECNPYWFNSAQVEAFFDAYSKDPKTPPPEILIELYLKGDQPEFTRMRGVHNSRLEDRPGLRIKIAPAAEFKAELDEYLADSNCPKLIPVEYYDVDWRDFSDELIRRRPKHLGLSFIDSRTIRSTSGVDYHTREMLTDFVEPKERADISVRHRKARHAITTDALGGINARIAQEAASLHDDPIGLQVDQSTGSSWETSLVPQVADIPFAMVGQGLQAAVKVALAMHRSAETTCFVLIEEPENHLAHTSLTRLLARVVAMAGDRQVFVTTHSSYVLNRLGLDRLILLHEGKPADFGDLPADTVEYFKRLSGYDTLRLVLAHKLVLVEGPSDEILFERAFRDRNGGGATPMDRGVDVVSMDGVSLRRGLELCAALDRQVVALRDNDGKPVEHWIEPLKDLLDGAQRSVIVSDPAQGPSLEQQLVAVNDDATLRTVLQLAEDEQTVDWMKSHKTDGALRIATSVQAVNYPAYITQAIEMVS